MVALRARERTDRRFRSGVCALATVAVVLALPLVAVINTDSPALCRENDGVVADAAHYLEGLGTDKAESRHLQPKSVRVGPTMSGSSISRGVSRTKMVLEAGVTESGQACEKNPLYARHLDPAKYKFGYREIEEILRGNCTRVGKGGVRTVFLVEDGGRKLAVKTLNANKSLIRHEREVLTLDALRGHPHVVGMLGFSNTTVVTDFVPRSLFNFYLLGEDLPIRQLVSLAVDASKGLQALHEIAGAIHMDLKPSQVLISETGRGMLNDFNSVLFRTVRPDNNQAFCSYPTHKSTGARSPWSSPERMKGEPITDKHDIYAMAMVFYSVIAGRSAFHDYVDSLQHAQLKDRPKIDARWNTGFMEIVQDMWSESPNDRPSARQVVARMQKLLEELDAPGDW